MVYTIFRAKVAEQKKLHGLTNADIARMTGYAKQTVEAFMCSARESDSVARAIASVLEIEM